MPRWGGISSLVGVAIALTACAVAGGAPRAGVSGAASCALALEFQGRTYHGHEVRVAADRGRALGSGLMPSCDDGNGVEEPATKLDVVALPGVDSRVAVLTPDYGMTVWIEESVDKLPAEVVPFTRDRTCTTTKPLRVAGSWLGISEHVADDPRLRPPYQLEVHIDEASRDLRRYRGAEVSIDVTRQTRNPVTKQDIRNSLWAGGRISAEVHCEDGAFIVDELTVYPGR